MSDTMTAPASTFADAIAAHQAAVDRHRDLAASAAAKKAEIGRLQLERSRLIDRAAKGENVLPRDLAAADKAIADAARALVLADAIEASAFLETELAEIARLHAEAAKITEEVDQRNLDVGDALKELAEKVAAAGVALHALREQAFQADIAANAGRLFHGTLAAAVVNNATLRGQHAGEHPRVHQHHLMRLDPIWRVAQLVMVDPNDHPRPLDLGRLGAVWPRRDAKP